jgi:hypothetical protein
MGPAMVTVKLLYVHQDVDRHGNERAYFWRKGGPKVRIRETLGSQAFLDVYRGLLEDTQSGKLAPSRRPTDQLEPGTYRWIGVQYFKSTRFAGLDPRTQQVRRRVLELTCEEPIFPGAKESSATAHCRGSPRNRSRSSETARPVCRKPGTSA